MHAAAAVQGLCAEIIDNDVSGALLLAEYKSDGLVRRRRRSLLRRSLLASRGWIGERVAVLAACRRSCATTWASERPSAWRRCAAPCSRSRPARRTAGAVHAHGSRARRRWQPAVRRKRAERARLVGRRRLRPTRTGTKRGRLTRYCAQSRARRRTRQRSLSALEGRMACRPRRRGEARRSRCSRLGGTRFAGPRCS
jgi:hypothetical protein